MITSSSVQADPMFEPDGARQVRMQLVEAFLIGDIKAITERVNDGWSGLRFCKDGEAQPEMANALSEAEVLSEDSKTVRYKLRTLDMDREVVMSRDDNTNWKLDYDMLAGPFPHN